MFLLSASDELSDHCNLVWKKIQKKQRCADTRDSSWTYHIGTEEKYPKIVELNDHHSSRPVFETIKCLKAFWDIFRFHH